MVRISRTLATIFIFDWIRVMFRITGRHGHTHFSSKRSMENYTTLVCVRHRY